MIGATLGELWARAGHDVKISSRHPERLSPPAGVDATDVQTAVDFADVVLLAIPLGAVPGLEPKIREALRGKIVIDANNAIERREADIVAQIRTDGGGSGTWTARQLPGAKVVKAFNTVYFQTMKSQKDSDDPVAVPLAADDEDAMAVVEGLVRDTGMAPVRVGDLSTTARFDAGTEVWNSNATASQLRAALGL
jgi:predicted dinucleotide-binding enzyme